MGENIRTQNSWLPFANFHNLWREVKYLIYQVICHLQFPNQFWTQNIWWSEQTMRFLHDKNVTEGPQNYTRGYNHVGEDETWRWHNVPSYPDTRIIPTIKQKYFIWTTTFLGTIENKLRIFFLYQSNK